MKQVIDKLGGVPALARALGKPVTTVREWYNVDRIPAKHQRAVLNLAAAQGIPLTADEVIPAA